MEVIRDLDWCPEFPRGTTVTFGVLDGVHRGHRVVLLETVRTAVVEGCPSVVVTFDPRSYLDAAALRLLTDFEQKLELLEASEIDYVIELPADRIPDVPADAFDADEDPRVQWIVDEVLVNTLHARAVVVGENYHFGTQRWRTIEQVMGRSSDAGFRVVQIPVKSGRSATGAVVSAQSIRDLLAAGDVEAAAERLGRPHEVRAIVSVGDRRGRTIGFPTINLPLPDDVLTPAEGVYAGRYVRPDGERFRAAINIGRRPTFLDGATPLIEAHLLDFRGDLYGERGRLQFLHRLRDEQEFGGIDALTRQLAADVAAVRDHLPYV